MVTKYIIGAVIGATIGGATGYLGRCAGQYLRDYWKSLGRGYLGFTAGSGDCSISSIN